MKKLIVLGLLFSSLSSVFAFSCTDLKVNLKRGNESKDVLALQQFLVEKKFLTATPNGYFGPATVRAVQAYQKSIGLTNSGSVLALTRATIKKETCVSGGGGINAATTTQVTNTKATTTTVVSVPVKKGPAPIVTAVDKTVVLLGGGTDWTITVRGSNFSTSTNTIYLEKRDASKRYTIGTFASPDTKTISMPKSLGMLTFSCGVNCRQKLIEGEYFVVVETKEGGENRREAYVIVKDAVISSSSATTNASIPYVATSTRLGSFTFKANTPLKISMITFSLEQGKATTTNLTKVIFKDEQTGAVIPNAGAGIELYQEEYRNIGVYANVESTATIKALASFTLSVVETVGNKTTSFTTPTFPVAFDGEPLWVTEQKKKAESAPPNLISVDAVTILRNGTTTWQIPITGTGFSSTTNIVYLTSKQANRKYTIGTYPSKNNKTLIELPKSFGTTLVSCGPSCEEQIPAGDYVLTVSANNQESNGLPFSVRAFNVSSATAVTNSALPKKIKGARLGTVTFGANVSVTISAVKFAITLDRQTSSVSNFVFKDEVTGTTLVNAGKDIVVSASDSKIIGVYADIDTKSATAGTGTFTVEVTDYLGKKITSFTPKPIMFTLAAD
jgi:peptidoglycan hydrolase-like protein with peptidoglycan-binding domain